MSLSQLDINITAVKAIEDFRQMGCSEHDAFIDLVCNMSKEDRAEWLKVMEDKTEMTPFQAGLIAKRMSHPDVIHR